MRVFVTGASGFIGSAVTEELLSAGHSVVALARTEKSAQALSAKGIQPHPGSLDDVRSLREAAAATDGAIHLAFMHSLAQIPLASRLRIFLGGLPTGIVSRFMSVATEADRQAIDAMGAAFKGSGRPLVTTFGTMGLSHDGFRAPKSATEEDEPDPLSPGAMRAQTEEKVEQWASLGVRATVVRLAPSVHGQGDTGLVPQIIGFAKKRGESAYVGDGSNRWSAVHRKDAARLFRLALEQGTAGARYHGVAEEAIPFRQIADLIGQKLNVPVVTKTPAQAAKHFSFWARFAATDNPASSVQTREQLGWEPVGPLLLDDIARPDYCK